MPGKDDVTGFCSFEQAFRGLTGHDPFPWQARLYERFLQGDIPSSCTVPTGLGKTNAIAVWLIALARGARVPRRLAYVVNRRTVVDQTTNEVERLRANLPKLQLDGFGDLAVSTLRGQFADNQEWSANPTQPAVICGTVDMIGSRLLFGGYRIGFKSRPLHAGFLAQDCLLVHDESHLEPAFQKVIQAIEKEQSRERTRSPDTGGADERWPGLRVMALSATARRTAEAMDVAHNSFSLTAEELAPPTVLPASPEEPIHHVWRRLKAAKQLRLHQIKDDKPVDEVVGLAAEHRTSGSAILVYLRKVDDAMKAAEGIHKALKSSKCPQHVRTLTGTMRGQEREALLRDDGVFARFVSRSSRAGALEPAEGSVYLVCTSAGEVGVDISADHMICDLSTFDSMAQRFGRVNRYGCCSGTCIDVVHPAEFPEKHALTPARTATLKLLEQLDGDASPLALNGLDPAAREDAFAPEPTVLPATDILFDAWAMTTIRGDMPGRPPVAPYLHGLAEWEPPRTKLAWRAEVDVITPEFLRYYGSELPRNLLDDYPLKPHELLSDISDRVHKQLSEIAKRAGGDCPLWIVRDSGEIEAIRIGELIDNDRKRAVQRITDCTILLPPSVGGLASGGMLDGKAVAESAPPNGLDVADLWLGENGGLRRSRYFSDQPQPPDVPEGMTLVRTVDTRPGSEEFPFDMDGEPFLDEQDAEAEDGMVAVSHGPFWHWFARPLNAEDATRASRRPVEWDAHVNDVAGWAQTITDRLGLPPDLKQAVLLAARWHDLGKKRELWQRSIGNPAPGRWHAKGGKPSDGPPWRSRRLSEYRHEFGSLLDVTDPNQPYHAELESLSGEMRDVVLQLIAAHHGRARPYFPPEATVDPNHAQSAADEAALEVPRRYARLQRRFGRWGLAYLESLLRAADWAASANASTDEPEDSGGAR